MYNLIEHSNNYSKTSRSLWKYYRHEAALNYDGAIQNVLGNSVSFKSKIKITRKSLAAGKTNGVKRAVPLKYLSKFRKILEMHLTSCIINLIIVWSCYYLFNWWAKPSNNWFDKLTSQ